MELVRVGFGVFLDILIWSVVWLLGGALLAAVTWGISWLLSKVSKRTQNFKWDSGILIVLLIVEIPISQYGADRTFGFSGAHILETSIPSGLVALALLWWINRGAD